jgi:iron complex outermembrane recepter protein
MIWLDKRGETVSTTMRSLMPAVILASIAAWDLAAAQEASQTTKGQTAELRASEGLEEIVVTAERRSESLQRTAIAISAVTSEELQDANVTRPEDLQRIVPGLSVFRAFGGMNNIYVRGIGAQIANAFGDQSVAQSLDGVYVARGTALSGAFLDVQRVEILKGPQGTLYGRNATGGAINYISNRPELGTTGGGAEVQFGNYKDVEFKGFVNIPLLPTLAMRAAFGYIKHDGYIESSGTDDQDTQAGRLSFNFTPNDKSSLLVVTDYSQDRGNGTGEVVLNRTADHASAITGSPWTGPPIGNYAPANYDGTLQNPGMGCTLLPSPNRCVPPNTVTFNPNLYGPGKGGYALNPNSVGVWPPGGFLNNRNWGAMAQLDVTVGDFATFTAIPAYRSTLGRWHNPAGGYNTLVDTPADQSSVELRLASSNSRQLKWLAGLYYFDEKQTPTEDYWNFNQVPGGLITNQGTIGRRYHLKDTSYAAFTQATWSLTDAFRVTGGLRYTYEKKTGTGQFRIGEPAYTDIGGTPFCPVGVLGTTYDLPTSNCLVPLNNSKSWNATNWKAGMEYDLRPESLVYINVSTGFHAGGLNDGIPSSTYAASYEPEKITAYAVGSKNRFMDDRLQVNAEAFVWKFKRKQYGALSVLNPPVVGFPILNVGDLNEQGLDVDVNYRLTTADLFGVSFEYLHSKFVDYVFTPTSTVDCGAPLGFAPVLGIPIMDCRGKSVPNAPKFSATLSYEHVFIVQTAGDLTLGARSHVQSETDLTIGAPAWAKQKGYTTSDLWLSFGPHAGRYKLTLFVNNAENTEAYSNAQQSFNSNDPTWWGDIKAPRTFGGRFAANF